MSLANIVCRLSIKELTVCPSSSQRGVIKDPESANWIFDGLITARGAWPFDISPTEVIYFVSEGDLAEIPWVLRFLRSWLLICMKGSLRMSRAEIR